MHEGPFRNDEHWKNDIERRLNQVYVDVDRLWRRQRPQGEGIPVGGPWPPVKFTGPWDDEPPCFDCETECFRIEASGFAGELEQFNGTRCFTRSSDCAWTTSSADIPLLRYMSISMNESAEPPVVVLGLQGQIVTYRTNDIDCSITRNLTATPAPDEMTPLWPATLELVPVTCGECTPSTGTGTSTVTGTGTTTGTGTVSGCPPFSTTAWEWTGTTWVVGSGGMCSGQTGCEACPPDYPGEYVGQIVTTPCAPAPVDCSGGTGTPSGTGTTTGTGTVPPTGTGTNTGDPSGSGTGTAAACTGNESWYWNGDAWEWASSSSNCPAGCEACPPTTPGEFVGQLASTPCTSLPADCSGSSGTGTGGPTSPPTGTGTGTSGGTGTTAPTGTGTGTTSGTGTAATGTCSYSLAAAAWCVVGGVTHSLYNLATSCSVSGGGSCPAQLIVPGTAPTLIVPCGTVATYPCEGGGTEAGTEEGPAEEP